MSDFSLSTPVAFIIFNRPDTTEKVFNEIRRAKPPKLLVVADGPRPDRPDDVRKCAETRSIIERVDWRCEVLKNYSDVNLGCGVRPATGITWVFDQVEEAIILEDDCLPHPDFFRYCEELLIRYRNDSRIMHIAGHGWMSHSTKGGYSYYYSLLSHCTGWATWRRAWRYYDFEMKLFQEIAKDNRLYDILQDDRAARYSLNTLRGVYESDKSHVWDYQWTLTLWTQGGVCILPNANLISNLGFGPEATHTKDASSKLANLPFTNMHFPLKHPPFVIRDVEADRYAMSSLFTNRVKILSRIVIKLKNIMRRLLIGQ